MLYQYTKQKVNKVILAYDFGDLLVEIGRSGVVFSPASSYLLSYKQSVHSTEIKARYGHTLWELAVALGISKRMVLALNVTKGRL